MNLDPKTEQKLAELRADYLRSIPAKIHIMEQAWKAHLLKPTPETASLLQHHFHKLAGSGGTFQVPELSEAAKAMENFFRETPADRIPDESGIVFVTDYFRYLRELAAFHLSGPSEKEPDASATAPGVEPVALDNAEEQILVYLHSRDRIFCGEICAGLWKAGFEVIPFDELDQLRSALLSRKPAILMVDVPDEPDLVVSAVARIKEEMPDAPPLVITTTDASMGARVQLHQLGIAAYFTRPFSLPEVVVRLRQIHAKNDRISYRVVLLEDDLATAQHYSRLLRSAGVLVRHCDNPLAFMDVVRDFIPELVLVDFNLPGINGAKVVGILRQDKHFANMPILFLSSETDLDRQREALLAGADAFLTKDIEPRHLTSTVVNQIERSRAIEESNKLWVEVLKDEKEEITQRLRQLEQNFDYTLTELKRGNIKPGALIRGSDGETFEIIVQLGEGGMGSTFLAEKRNDRARVVIKFVFPDADAVDKQQALFLAEAQTLMRVSHPNLVHGIDFSQGPLFGFVVMDYVEGLSLDKILSTEGAIDPLSAASTIYQIVEGLCALEELGIVHRDIKPENIIVSLDGTVKLVDFSISVSSSMDADIGSGAFTLGTPQYISPEQIRYNKADHRSDIYSLGCTFFHLLTGTPPFPAHRFADVLKMRLKESPDPNEVHSGIPAILGEIVRTMMAIDPRNRFQHAADLLERLEKAIRRLEGDQ